MALSNPELNSAERLKNLVKLTGDIEVDAIANLKELLFRELKNDPLFAIKAIEIYDIDTEKVPRFPAICLDLKGSETQQRTIGKDRATFLRSVYVDVWYYHADVNDKIIETELRKTMSRINSVIVRNADLNGYCRMGVRLGSVLQVDKVFGERIVRGVKFPLTIPILYRDRSAGPDSRF